MSMIVEYIKRCLFVKNKWMNSTFGLTFVII